MQAAELTPGTVVYDGGLDSVPHERRFFRVVKGMHPQVGPWVLEQVASKHQRTVVLGQIDRLEPVDAEPFVRANFDGLVGKTVRLKTKWGSTLTGEVGAIEYFEFRVNEQVFRLPQRIVLGGDLFEIDQIEGIEYGEKAKAS